MPTILLKLLWSFKLYVGIGLILLSIIGFQYYKINTLKAEIVVLNQTIEKANNTITEDNLKISLLDQTVKLREAQIAEQNDKIKQLEIPQPKVTEIVTKIEYKYKKIKEPVNADCQAKLKYFEGLFHAASQPHR